MTVGIPPVYAESIEGWALKEAELVPNDATVDQSAIDMWDQVYPELRNQLWHAEATSDRHRRLLVAMELRHEMLRIRTAVARGEIQPDPEPYLARILDFAKSYPEPLDASDNRQTIYWLISSLLELAVGREDIFLIDEARVKQFGQELVNLDKSIPSVYGQKLADTGIYSHAYWSRTWNSRLKPHLNQVTDEEDSDLYGGVAKDQIYPALLYSIYDFPGLHQPATPEGDVIFAHDYFVSAKRFFEIGLASWEYMNFEDKRVWLWQVSIRPPRYHTDLWDSFFQLSSSFGDEVLEPDTKQQEQHIERVHLLVDELVTHPAFAEEERARFAHIPLWNSFEQLIESANLDTSYERDRRTRLIEGIEEYYRVYGGSQNVDMRSLSVALSSTERAGISEDQLFGMLVRLSESPHEKVRGVAVAALDSVSLEVGTKVSIQLPDLDGDVFDTDELRGKFVLVDHWDTNCGPCIAAMPGIHETYLEYQDSGFEVVSIAYDAETSRQSVERYKDRMGLTWTTLNGEGAWPVIAARYGYPGYPQYMLLDRQGRYVAGTAEMGNGANLEALLDELLAAEAAEKKAATVH